ncbi:MAG: hypothetical protein GY705_16120 [Bacteroidetes bacterium]|nr:hypothetical protein [Bacteroidota bacterium]
MARKVKMTGFARFLIAMLIIGPLAYLAASYYNGEDGIGNIKKLLGLEEQTEIVEDHSNNTNAANENTTLDLKRLEDELELKEQQIKKLYQENGDLTKQLEQKETLIKELQSKVEKVEEGQPAPSDTQ